MAVYPANDSTLVSQLGEILGADLDVVMSLNNLDGESPNPRPTPTPLPSPQPSRVLEQTHRSAATKPSHPVSLQRIPTRSTPSPAPRRTARPSPTTWTSPTRRAPTCSTSWPSTPPSPPSRSSCARWPRPRARARWALTFRRPHRVPPPRPCAPRPRLTPPPSSAGAVPELGGGGPEAHPGHPAGLPVPAAPHRPPVRAAAPPPGPLLLHRLVLQGAGPALGGRECSGPRGC